jgi:hypothetical protein
MHGIENVKFILEKTATCILHPEKDEGSRFHQNFAAPLPHYMVSQPRRP